MIENDDRASISASVARLLLVPKPAVVKLACDLDPDNASRYKEERLDEIVRRLSRVKDLNEEMIRAIFDKFRYPRRISLYTFLVGSPETITQSALRDGLAATTKEDEDSLEPVIGEESHRIGRVELCNEPEEQFEGIRESRFRYIRQRSYLDETETLKQYRELGFGFVWVDDEAKVLIVLCRDEGAARMIARGVNVGCEAAPLPGRFSKEILKRHFDPNNRRRFSLYDPVSRERSIVMRPSRDSNGEMWRDSERLDNSYHRTSDFYEEELGENAKTGLGITSDKGRIYLTRTIAAPVFRKWAPLRLRGLISDVRSEFDDLLAMASRIDVAATGLNIQGAKARALATRILALVASVIRDRGGQGTVPLLSTMEEVSMELKQHFLPTGEVYCGKCLGPVPVKDTTPQMGDEVEDIFGHRIRLDDNSRTLQPTASFVLAAQKAAASLMGTAPREDITFCLSGGMVHVFQTKPASSFACSFDDIDVLAAAAPPLIDLAPDEVEALELRLCKYKEKCTNKANPSVKGQPTSEDCEACSRAGLTSPTNRCLMRLFAGMPEYRPSPHGGAEPGDVMFLCRVEGQQWWFKGLAKGQLKNARNHRATISSRSDLGKDLLSQVVTQYFADGRDAILGIVTCNDLQMDLKMNITELVKRRQGRSLVCFVGPSQLLRLLHAVAPTPDRDTALP